MSHFRMKQSSGAGFTLLEMAGVLSIISILASVAIPSIITRINRANAAKESKNLETIGGALESYLLKSKSIPDETTWAQSIAGELGVSLTNVTRSTGQQPRVYLVDPAISIADQTGVLPYTQDANGSNLRPENVRILILSSRLLELPDFLSSGVAPSVEVFENIWAADRHEVPTGWPLEWQDHGDDLHVERKNLTPLFHRVIINDITDDVQAEVSVDGEPSMGIPAGGLSAYYFAGTELSLMNNGLISSREAIDRDLSFTYERGLWRGRLWEGKMVNATELASALDDFRLSRLTAQASQNSSQQAVIDAYSNYMAIYTAWSRSGNPAAALGHPILPEVVDILERNGFLLLNQSTLALETLQGEQFPVPLYQSLLDAQSQFAGLAGSLILD